MRALLAVGIVALIAGCTAPAAARLDSPSPSTLAAATNAPSATSSAPSSHPSPQPTDRTRPTDTPAPTDPPDAETPTPAPRSPIPPQPSFTVTPLLETAAGDLVASVRGGCGTVLYLAEGMAFDDCGPGTFDEELAAPPIEVPSGGDLVLVAPASWRMGTDPSVAEQWAVRIAGTRRLAGQVETYHGFPEGVGRTLDDGTAPRRVIRVAADVQPGDYLLQLDGGMTRDGWSLTAVRWYWHLRVE